MLQMARIAREAQRKLASTALFPPSWSTMTDLEQVTDEWMGKWLRQRTRLAEQAGLTARVADGLDRLIRTGRPERTDDPAVSPDRKLKIVRNIHLTNMIMGVYRHYIRILTPVIMKVAAERKRPARLLELASGSGEMAMNLARLALKKNLPVEVTGSDYVEDVVAAARRRSDQRGLNVNFRVINAFDMDVLKPGEYDIFILIGTMHHFTPGQLAVIMSQSCRYAGSAFVGIDGYRCLPLLLWLAPLHVITFSRDNIHDAWMTARKYYSLPELEWISRIAVPGAESSVSFVFPGLSVVQSVFRDGTREQDVRPDGNSRPE